MVGQGACPQSLGVLPLDSLHSGAPRRQKVAPFRPTKYKTIVLRQACHPHCRGRDQIKFTRPFFMNS